MTADRKEYNRAYYEGHRHIWRKNYANNADARRKAAREYAAACYKSDPEYRARHSKEVVRRTRIMRRISAVARASAKLLKLFQKISEKNS